MRGKVFAVWEKLCNFTAPNFKAIPLMTFKHLLTIFLFTACLTATADNNDTPPRPTPPLRDYMPSCTEGVITADFVEEGKMMTDLLQMLANFSRYMAADYQACVEPNSKGEACGCFKGEHTMASNEAGVRTNADLSMICAFLVKYAQPAGIHLHSSLTWERLEDIAMKSLVFAYSTHKANRLKTCAGGDYWGSTGNDDHVWESSLWAMSVAYSAFFQWDKLSEEQRGYIHQLLKAECNYELERDIPTGYKGDTKAEENGWEADVLAATLGLFPDDPLAPKWFARLREFAINSYSHPADAHNHTRIDPDHEGTVADLYQGPNLYDDYTLQNHHLFHTSYQNVVMQELGEAALALKMFQTGLGRAERWKTNALMHNNQKVMDEVLNWLALTDGELAMPNGNDWSLFLYDQITSYTTLATMLRDPNALMLENLAYKYIKARQGTTPDGSWLLRPDVQARRMGVQGHRVMMTYLMHLAYSTADLTPTRWEDFRAAHSEARVLKCQNVVRAFTPDRFTTFSWSEGLKSYTGYIAANSVDKNKIIVPYRANNTGNFIGWYTVEGKRTNATPIVKGVYQLKGDSYVMNGQLHTNDATLDQRFAIYSTPGNAVIYLDQVTALADGTITGERGGLMAISVDELTRTKRRVLFPKGFRQSDGRELFAVDTDWLNIDDQVGFVSRGKKQMAFGDQALNNSILTARLYASYSTEQRPIAKGDVVDRRNVVYYSNIDNGTTEQMAHGLQVLADQLPKGWNGAIAKDTAPGAYLLLSHFAGDTDDVTLGGITCNEGAPVFETETTVSANLSTARFHVTENSSTGQVLHTFILCQGTVKAWCPADRPNSVWLTAPDNETVGVCMMAEGKVLKKKVRLEKDKPVFLYVDNGKIKKDDNGAQPSSLQ